MVNYKLFDELIDTLIESFDGCAVITDLGITYKGTLIDVVRAERKWDGGMSLSYYAGRPDLDGTDEEGDWEEIQPSDKEENRIMKEILNLL